MHKTGEMIDCAKDNELNSQIASVLLTAVYFYDLLAITDTKPHTKDFCWNPALSTNVCLCKQSPNNLHHNFFCHPYFFLLHDL